MGEPVMTPAEVAEKYKIPKSTVSFWVLTQQIPFHRLSKRVVRFDEMSSMRGGIAGKISSIVGRYTRRELNDEI